MRGVRSVVAAGLLAMALAGCGQGVTGPEEGMEGAAAAVTAPTTTSTIPTAPTDPAGDEGADPDASSGRGADGSTTAEDATATTASARPGGSGRAAPEGEVGAVTPPTEAPRAGRSVEALADQIAGAEAVVRDPASSEARVAREAHRQQVAYRELALHPEWLDPVLDALPADLRTDALHHVAARQEFLDMASEASLAPGPPAEWRVDAPAPADDLLRWYRGAGREYGVEWEVLAAINLVETGLGRIRADSVAGAQGPMQFMPATWARWGNGDVQDPHHAIYGAARYLAASGAADGRLTDALWAYNHDDRYVRAVNLYAGLLRRTPLLFRGLYHWQVYYRSAAGDLLLPEGYPTVPASARP
ncbi:MAG: transglycosylase SLT domain-containing protein [Acidimicrobiales bacterium]|nr:transglycosylase SLT domain-containing protein [Acidimicrobiales bacterium]